MKTFKEYVVLNEAGNKAASARLKNKANRKSGKSKELPDLIEYDFDSPSENEEPESPPEDESESSPESSTLSYGDRSLQDFISVHFKDKTTHLAVALEDFFVGRKKWVEIFGNSAGIDKGLKQSTENLKASNLSFLFSNTINNPTLAKNYLTLLILGGSAIDFAKRTKGGLAKDSAFMKLYNKQLPAEKLKWDLFIYYLKKSIGEKDLAKFPDPPKFHVKDDKLANFDLKAAQALAETIVDEGIKNKDSGNDGEGGKEKGKEESSPKEKANRERIKTERYKNETVSKKTIDLPFELDAYDEDMTKIANDLIAKLKKQYKFKEKGEESVEESINDLTRRILTERIIGRINSGQRYNDRTKKYEETTGYSSARDKKTYQLEKNVENAKNSALQKISKLFKQYEELNSRYEKIKVEQQIQQEYLKFKKKMASVEYDYKRSLSRNFVGNVAAGVKETAQKMGRKSADDAEFEAKEKAFNKSQTQAFYSSMLENWEKQERFSWTSFYNAIAKSVKGRNSESFDAWCKSNDDPINFSTKYLKINGITKNGNIQTSIANFILKTGEAGKKYVHGIYDQVKKGVEVPEEENQLDKEKKDRAADKEAKNSKRKEKMKELAGSIRDRLGGKKKKEETPEPEAEDPKPEEETEETPEVERAESAEAESESPKEKEAEEEESPKPKEEETPEVERAESASRPKVSAKEAIGREATPLEKEQSEKLTGEFMKDVENLLTISPTILKQIITYLGAARTEKEINATTRFAISRILFGALTEKGNKDSSIGSKMKEAKIKDEEPKVKAISLAREELTNLAINIAFSKRAEMLRAKPAPKPVENQQQNLPKPGEQTTPLNPPIAEPQNQNNIVPFPGQNAVNTSLKTDKFKEIRKRFFA